MDLTRLSKRAAPAAMLSLLAVLPACTTVETVELTQSGVELPATLMEAYEIAETVALDWSPHAYVTRIGGGFTIMDETGRARDHTFVFHAREGFSHKKLKLHLINGGPWMGGQTVGEVAPLLVGVEDLLDSDVVVVAAIAIADSINAIEPDQIPAPTHYSARTASVPLWPEPPGSTELAWRVDFLVRNVHSGTNSLVWWSIARFYFDPVTGEPLGDPVLPPTGRELYPWENLN